ncbi:MAG: C25 family cysteine peptidase [Acidobacteriota bacterium]
MLARLLHTRIRPARYLTALPLAFLAFGQLGCGSDPGPNAFHIEVDRTDLYRVDYVALTELGLRGTRPSTDLAVTHLDEPVPIRVEDGGDGEFGPGDAVFFVGRELDRNGDAKRHNRNNVYRLAWDGVPSPRMTELTSSETRDDDTTTSRALSRSQHLEVDKLMIRLDRRHVEEDEQPDVWMWAKLSQIDRKPFTVDLDLRDLPTDATLELTIGARALSRIPRRPPDFAEHAVDVLFDGVVVHRATWDGDELTQIELDGSDVAPGRRELGLRVPKRINPLTDEPIIDVVMIDEIQLRYRNGGLFVTSPTELDVAAGEGDVMLTAGGDKVVAYSTAGERAVSTNLGEGRHQLPVSSSDDSWLLVSGDVARSPVVIFPDRPSDLRNPANRADYLMIAHESLLEATEPLAALHRERGLEVALIDVQDIYDEYNGGLVHPRAIRDFIATTHHEWQEPRPQFVLLVGDASWDTHNTTIDDANYANWSNRQLTPGRGRFLSRDTTTYGEQPEFAGARNLIPTWSYHGVQGQSASDNYFVTVDGDDFLPDLAIGRLPLYHPEEVAAVVTKTRQYLESPPDGDWRRSLLWISNEQERYQRASDRLATSAEERGFANHRVYPDTESTANTDHQRALIDAFDEGQLVAHFIGHGGRNIWRTAEPDFENNKDLFTLDHVDTLEPHGRLPMVLSMTCFSAPFDHPNADSIGEKLLRTPDRGAIAVFAASWRNNPSFKVTGSILDEMLAGVPIGTAIQRAKRDTKSRTLIETYNLLGDPALVLALPEEMEVPSSTASSG